MTTVEKLRCAGLSSQGYRTDYYNYLLKKCMTNNLKSMYIEKNRGTLISLIFLK